MNRNFHRQLDAIFWLSNRFELRPRREHWPNVFFIEDFLQDLEARLEILLKEQGEEEFIFLDDAKDIQARLLSITYNDLQSISYEIDYNLELRQEISVISEENHPLIFHCLVALPKHKNEGLIRETHGIGFHIHYVRLVKKKQSRTDVLFTFDSREVSQNTHTLFWENHGPGIPSDPERFGKRRRIAIHDTSCGFLNKIPKHEFRAPSREARALWPA